MFFPTDILVRKGRFGLIWLAATHSSERTNVLSRRDYLKVNIPKSCHDIIHPSIPFALRLSSHLMLGVSRIFGKQTKFVLDETTQIWVKAHDSLVLSGRSLELAAPMTRHDAITMSDPIESETMHYILEPFRLDMGFDPASLYASDSNYLNVNGSTFLSPSLSTKSSSSEAVTSPLQAHRKEITMPDTLFSPNQIIEVPGEVDFGPVLEEDPFEKFDVVMGEAIDNVAEVQAEPSQQQSPSVQNQTIDQVDEAMNAAEPDVIPIEPSPAAESPEVVADASKKDQTPKERSWEEVSRTPSPDERSAGRAPSRPRKRKRLAVDREILMKADEIRSNLADPASTQRHMVIGRTPLLSVNDLFSQPAITYLASEYMAENWHHNSRTFPDETLHENFAIMDEESESYSPDRILRQGVTPSSIEIPRAAPEISTDFERSAASTLTMDATPRTWEERSVRQPSVTENKLQRLSSRGESRGLGELPNLSPIADEFVDDLAVPLEEIDEDQFATEIGQDDIPSPKQEQFLRTLSNLLENKENILFSDIAPPRTSRRKMAARAFSYALALNARQVIELDQKELFGEITIRRGRAF